MKSKYISPEIEIVKLVFDSALLSSDPEEIPKDEEDLDNG